VPWLDEQVAWPFFFPLPRSGNATSGPFRLASRRKGRLVLERNLDYWNVSAVKPRRVVLTTSADRVDGVLPRGVLAAGFPWVKTTTSLQRGRRLPTLSLGLLWLVTKGGPLADPRLRERVYLAALDRPGGLPSFVPPAMPGYSTIVPGGNRLLDSTGGPARLTLAYTKRDARAPLLARELQGELALEGVGLALKAAPTLADLLRLAGPPAQTGVDLVLLGWSSEFFDEYNILDLFPCASAFNIGRWCDRGYDRLMSRAVREMDDEARYRIERELVKKLKDAVPAIPLYAPKEHVLLNAGVRGFRWSPIGFYELMGMTRS
jgi:ABC-type transport system substrate-binding protein